MAKPARNKKLTQREKTLKAECKKELQEKGIIPQNKPKLNRKKFAKEVIAEYEAKDGLLYSYIMGAIFCMVGPNMREVTPEQVGVLKILKIAMETKKFEESLPEGVHNYKIGEYLEKVVIPIIKL